MRTGLLRTTCLAAGVLAGLGLAACNDDKKVSGESSRDSSGDEDGESPAESTENSVELPEVFSDNKPVEGIDSYQNVRGSGFLVKNNLQLRSAADSCLGPGLGTITDDMFAQGRCQPGTGGAPADKLVILGADKCANRGQHIFDVLADQLWSPDLAGRTDTLANQLTPSYLQALAQAADVYAHGVADLATLCGTAEKTRDFLTRCLPQAEGGDLGTVVDKITAICAAGGAQARQAVATVLGSAAFAAAAPLDKAASDKTGANTGTEE